MKIKYLPDGVIFFIHTGKYLFTCTSGISDCWLSQILVFSYMEMIKFDYFVVFKEGNSGTSKVKSIKIKLYVPLVVPYPISNDLAD